MGASYSRLGCAERVTIMLMRREGKAVRSIARSLGRHASTISRELKRQPDHGILPYMATRAEGHAFAMRVRCRNRRKLRVGGRLFATVAAYLRSGWSPLQIAGRLKRMHEGDPKLSVCHETIYRALYALPRGELRRELLSCLRQGHKTRWPRSRGASRREKMPAELRIAARPEEVKERLVPGHWEGDLLKGAYNRSAIGTLIERSSRLVLLARLDGMDALSAQHGFERLFNDVPKNLRKSLTYDRGSEMARHRELTIRTGVKVYFADPYSPWQRGSNENANGLIRQYLPKGSELSVHSQADLDRIADLLNHRPRKVLGFRTPWEVYSEVLDQTLKRARSTKRASPLRRVRRLG